MEKLMNAGIKKAGGLTLIELLVTVIIAVVLATVAVPGFQGMIKNNQLAADYNEILASLNYARSEAVKRRLNVAAIVDSTSPWRIVIDASGSVGTLRVSEGRDDRVSIRGPSSVVFNSLGRRASCDGNDVCELEVSMAGEVFNKIEINVSGSVN